MNALQRLARFVEWRTKATSLLVFAYCLALSLYHGVRPRPLATLFFFASTLLIDCATTALNHLRGWRREGEALPYDAATARRLIALMIALAAALGLALVVLTGDLLLLPLGALAFATGFAYSHGPWPLLDSPFAELASGLIYGLFIPLIYLRITSPGALLHLHWLPEAPTAHGAVPALVGAAPGPGLAASLALVPTLRFALVCLIPICLVAAVMLANNCADLARDRAHGRRSLAARIGLGPALALYRVISLAPFALVVLGVIAGVFGRLALLVLVLLPWAVARVRRYCARPDKARSFPLALVQLRQLMLLLSASLALEALLGRLGPVFR